MVLGEFLKVTEKKWFANRGQIIQVVVAILALCISVVTASRGSGAGILMRYLPYVAGGLFLLLLGILVGQRSASSSRPERQDLKTGEFAYSCDYSTFLMDMSDWKRLSPGVDKRSQKISPATLTRSDLLRKRRSSKDDYRLLPWTTGAGIDILQPPKDSSFKEVSTDGAKKTYEFMVPLGKEPEGASCPIFVSFTMWNGFQEETVDEWRAQIKVPTVPPQLEMEKAFFR
jgi:hypothetical protein